MRQGYGFVLADEVSEEARMALAALTREVAEQG